MNRQRYFNFMKSAAVAVPHERSLLTEAELRRRWPAHYEVTQRVASVHPESLGSTTVRSCSASTYYYLSNITRIGDRGSAFQGQYHGSRLWSSRGYGSYVRMPRRKVQRGPTSRCSKWQEGNTDTRSRNRYAASLKDSYSTHSLSVCLGTGALTAYLLPILDEFPQVAIEYVATDISLSLVSATLTRIGHPQARPQAYDISKDPVLQGLAHETFDIVTGLNVLHVVPQLVPCLQNLHKLLVPGGSLLYIDFDGTDWPSTPGTTWYDFVFGGFKEWFSFQDIDLRSHCTLSLKEWDRVLLSHGFTSVSNVKDGRDSLFAVIHAQKEATASKALARTGTLEPSLLHCVHYHVGKEVEIQRELKSFTLDDQHLLWLVAAEGENGDALLGFGRSLAKEIPAWTIKLAIVAPALLDMEGVMRSGLSDLSSHVEKAFYFDSAANIHVARVVPAASAASPNTRRFDRNDAWIIEEGQVSHVTPPIEHPGEVIVAAEDWTTACSHLRAFAGTIVGGNDGPFSVDDTVVGITSVPECNILAISHTSLARIPHGYHDLRSLVHRVLPAAIATAVNSLKRASRRQGGRERRVLLVNIEPRLRDLLGTILSRLGWTVSHEDSLLSSHIQRSQECLNDVVVCSRDHSQSLFARRSNSRTRVFPWDDYEEGLSAHLHDPNFGEDLEAVLELLPDSDSPDVLLNGAVSLPSLGTLVPYRGTLFRPDRTYLLVGGIGGLGIQIAAWMYEVSDSTSRPAYTHLSLPSYRRALGTSP